MHFRGSIKRCIRWVTVPEGKGYFRSQTPSHCTFQSLQSVLCCHLVNTNKELGGLGPLSDTTLCPELLSANVRFLRSKAECFGRLCHRLGVCLSVCPSVRPSVTLVICIKTVQARITKSLLWAAPRSLVYRDKISCHWVKGFLSNEGVEEGYPPKKMSFCRYWLE